MYYYLVCMNYREKFYLFCIKVGKIDIVILEEFEVKELFVYNSFFIVEI